MKRDVRSLQRYERPDIKTKVCLDGGLLVSTKKRTVLTRRRKVLIAGRKELEIILRKIL